MVTALLMSRSFLMAAFSTSRENRRTRCPSQRRSASRSAKVRITGRNSNAAR